MNTSKGKKIAACVIMGLLSLAGVYAEIVVCAYAPSFQMIAETVLTCVMLVLIAYYVIANFKVPHGNLLRYMFLAFAAMCFVGLLNVDTSGAISPEANYIFQIARGAVVVLSTFTAGRLDRLKQNTVLMVISAILLLATSVECIVIYKAADLISILLLSNFFILWLDLMIAYLFRYYSHKEAGLADKN